MACALGIASAGAARGAAASEDVAADGTAEPRLDPGTVARAAAVTGLPDLRLDPGALRVARAGPPALERAPPPPLPPGEAGPTPWRAVLEEGAALGIGAVGYSTTRVPAPGARPVPAGDKLRFSPGAWGFDADNRGLNYVGHPADGLLFYALARGNRLGTMGSLGLTVATATGWELVEYQELLSVHDIAASSAGGYGLGESFTQLSAWLRQQPGVLARAASVLFQPPRAMHDAFDRAPPPPRAAFGVADVAAWSGAGRSSPSPAGAGELRLGARARLVRSEDVGAPGTEWSWLLDGNVTSLSAELATDRAGISQVDVRALASLAGLYGRDLDDAGEGHDLLATASLGYDYLRRPVEVAGRWDSDDLSLLRIPGVELVARLRRTWRAELGVEAAVTLGGVDPLALAGLPTDVPGAPGVLRHSGYYHGLGWMLAPRASLEVGAVELSVSWRVDRLRAIEGHDVSPPPDGGRLALEDARRDLRVGVACRTPVRQVRLVGAWERVDRGGRAGAVTASQRGTTAWLGLALGGEG